MGPGKTIVRRLAWLGRPTPARFFVRTWVRAFDAAFLLLPFLVFAGRATGRLTLGDRGAVPWAVGLVVGVPVLSAFVALLFRRGDPRRAARELDAEDGADRYLAALDAVRREKSSPFLPLLLRDVWGDLESRPEAALVRGTLRPPAFLRNALCLLAALIVLFVPSFGNGVFGAEEGEGGSAERSGDGDTSVRDDLAESDAPLTGKVQLEVSTDRTLYGLGDEILLRVRLKTLEPNPEGVALALVARVDGEVMMPLPVDWVLPTAAGEELAVELPIRDRLKAIERYRRGLLAIDTFVAPRLADEVMRGAVPGNRVVIQIAENTNRVRSRTPSPADKKQKKKPQRQPKQPDEKTPQKPDEKKPDSKPRPDPRGDQPGGAPPEEIDSKPFVIEPLFSGDQTSKREVPKFDRREKDSDRPPPTTPPESRRHRGYELTEEVQIDKLVLPGREKRIVRRYLDGLRAKKKP